MNDALNIGLFVLIIAGCVLVISLIAAVRRAIAAISVLQEEIRALRAELGPGIRSVALLADETRDTLEAFATHREALGAAASNVRRVSENVVRIQELLFDRIEPPLEEAASLLTSFMKGFNAFRAAWKKRD